MWVSYPLVCGLYVRNGPNLCWLLAAVANRAENGVAHSKLAEVNRNARPTNYVVNTHSDDSAPPWSFQCEGQTWEDTHTHTPAHSPINKAPLVSAAHCPVRPNKEPSFPCDTLKTHTQHTPIRWNTEMLKHWHTYTHSTIRNAACWRWGELLPSKPIRQNKHKCTCWAITLVERDAAPYTCDTMISQSCAHNALEWRRQSQVPKDWGLFVWIKRACFNAVAHKCLQKRLNLHPSEGKINQIYSVNLFCLSVCWSVVNDYTSAPWELSERLNVCPEPGQVNLRRMLDWVNYLFT